MSDYKYTLTRFCLRSGQLSLPHSMLELFPDEGPFEVEDTLKGETLTLTMLSPRKVGGLTDFMQSHGLGVNDQIAVSKKEAGYAFTALPHKASPQRFQEAERLLDDLYSKATPLSEAEIRALYGGASDGVPLAEKLVADERFVLIEGRWHTDLTLAEPDTHIQSNADEGPGERVSSESVVEDLSNDLASTEPPSTGAPTGEANLRSRPEDAGETVDPLKEALNEYGAKQEKPKPSWAKPKRASVIPYPRGVIFPTDTGLNSELETADLSQQKRAKTLLGKLGYRVEGLAHGQLLAHADLGRKHHSILVHVLPEKTKLDWAALLSRRRETGSEYLAVIGHELDLIPFEAPAELARASLWPWNGIGRLESVLELVPVSPMDLRSHFERDGLSGKGLERFERTVQGRIQERGTFSAVLTRLAAMKAPAIFLLDDVTHAELPREHALKVLEQLGQAPFHLVSKVDSGEFCLRYKVGDSLIKLSEYALSLRDRLPNRRTERLRGELNVEPLLSTPATLSETETNA